MEITEEFLMADVAEDIREGMLALAVGAGLKVMSALMEADAMALTGPHGRHNVAVRHGTGAGSVTLGGRRVATRTLDEVGVGGGEPVLYGPDDVDGLRRDEVFEVRARAGGYEDRFALRPTLPAVQKTATSGC